LLNEPKKIYRNFFKWTYSSNSGIVINLLPEGEGAGGEGRLDVDEALVAAAAEA